MKVLFLFLISSICTSLIANDRFLRLIVEDRSPVEHGPRYWATVQATDDNTGTIQTTDNNGNSYTYQNSKNEFLVDTITALNYRIPRKSWGTQIVIRVYRNKPQVIANPFGAVDKASIARITNDLIAQANIVQDDGAGWVINTDQMNKRLIVPIQKDSQGNVLYRTVTSPVINNSNTDLPIRVLVTKDGIIQLLTT